MSHQVQTKEEEINILIEFLEQCGASVFDDYHFSAEYKVFFTALCQSKTLHPNVKEVATKWLDFAEKSSDSQDKWALQANHLLKCLLLSHQIAQDPKVDRVRITSEVFHIQAKYNKKNKSPFLNKDQKMIFSFSVLCNYVSFGKKQKMLHFIERNDPFHTTERLSAEKGFLPPTQKYANKWLEMDTLSQDDRAGLSVLLNCLYEGNVGLKHFDLEEMLKKHKLIAPLYSFACAKKVKLSLEKGIVPSNIPSSSRPRIM